MKRLIKFKEETLDCFLKDDYDFLDLILVPKEFHVRGSWILIE